MKERLFRKEVLTAVLAVALLGCTVKSGHLMEDTFYAGGSANGGYVMHCQKDWVVARSKCVSTIVSWKPGEEKYVRYQSEHDLPDRRSGYFNYYQFYSGG